MTRRTEKLNTPLKLVERADFSFGGDCPAGQASWRYNDTGEIHGILYGCPCGCGAVHGAFFPNSPYPTTWTWDGNLTEPTLEPSLGLYPKDDQARDGSNYHWHGYLKKGVFEER